MAITIVEQSGGQYHVLVIIADGQVLCFGFMFDHNSWNCSHVQMLNYN